MRQRVRLPDLLLLTLIFCPPLLAAIAVPEARDLRADGRLAEQLRLPILLLVSQQDCIYCERLKEEVIRPMIRSGEYRDKVLIRELHMDAGRRVRDFSGRPRESVDLAHAYGVSLTPTILLLDPSGKPLQRPIVGVTTLEMYGYYLDEAIEAARRRLREEASLRGVRSE